MVLEKSIPAVTRLRNGRFYIFCILVAFISISKAAIEIAFGLIFFLWLIENVLVKKWKIREYFPKTKLNLPIAILLVVLSLTIFNSFAPAKSLRSLFGKWIQYVMLYFFTVGIVDSRKKFKIILSIFSISLTLILVDGLWQFATGVDFLRSRPIEGFWIRGYFCGLNPFGGFLILLSPIVVSFLLTNKKIIKICGIFVFGLSTTCLLLSCSLISWVALVLSLSITLFFSKRKVVSAIPVLILLLILIISFLPTFRARILEGFRGVFYSEGGRINIWKEYSQELVKTPFLGKGINTTTVQIAKKYSQLPLVIKANPHSWYLLIVLEAGLLGLLAYFWFLTRTFKVFLSSKKDLLWYGLFTGFLAFVIVNIVDNIWDERIQSLFWIIIGLSVVRNKLLVTKHD
ncbi:MAG: O-antigen ligase family protein [Candidatus Omnitrophota bacterium]